MSMQDFLFSLKLTIQILTGTHWVFCDQRWWTLEPHVSLLFTLLQPHRSRWWGLKVNAGESWGVDSGLTSETLQHTESDLNIPDSSLFLIGKLVRIEHAYLQKKKKVGVSKFHFCLLWQNILIEAFQGRKDLLGLTVEGHHRGRKGNTGWSTPVSQQRKDQCMLLRSLPLYLYNPGFLVRNGVTHSRHVLNLSYCN